MLEIWTTGTVFLALHFGVRIDRSFPFLCVYTLVMCLLWLLSALSAITIFLVLFALHSPLLSLFSFITFRIHADTARFTRSLQVTRFLYFCTMHRDVRNCSCERNDVSVKNEIISWDSYATKRWISNYNFLFFTCFLPFFMQKFIVIQIFQFYFFLLIRFENFSINVVFLIKFPLHLIHHIYFKYSIIIMHILFRIFQIA
jgi:hypothetical protein